MDAKQAIEILGGIRLAIKVLEKISGGLPVLTEEEIIEASQVTMFLPNGELDPDCGYLRGRQQVAQAQVDKIKKWLEI